MEMDKGLQHRILMKLCEHYPERVVDNEVPGYGEPDYEPTLHYLNDKGLIDAITQKMRDVTLIMSPRITAEGIDFLGSDSGLNLDLKRRILMKLHEHHPERVVDNEVPGYGEPDYEPTLHYLNDKGLIDAITQKMRDVTLIMSPKITMAGIDFIAESS